MALISATTSSAGDAERGRAVERATEVVDHHLGPFGREEQRVLAPNAATGSGDDGDASVKSTHGYPP
jgi:hypothetical protein